MSNYLDNTGLTTVLVKIKSLLAQKANITSIPTKVSQLTNDSGYLTTASLSVPEKVSELENDSNYQTDTEVSTSITSAINDLDVDSYSNDTTYYSDNKLFVSNVKQVDGKIQQSKYSLPIAVSSIVNDLQTVGRIPTSASVASQIAIALEGVSGIEVSVVTALPSSPTKGTIYLVPKGTYDTSTVTVSDSEDEISTASTDTITEQDAYDEFICIDVTATPKVYEKIGSTDVDLTPYAKTDDVNTAITNAINGIKTTTTTIDEDKGSDNIQYFNCGVQWTGDSLWVITAKRANVTDTAVDGQYVSAVNQTNDKITVTRSSLPSVEDSAVDGKYVSSVSQTDGKITVTRATLPTGGTSDTPIPNDTIDAIFTEVFS